MQELKLLIRRCIRN